VTSATDSIRVSTPCTNVCSIDGVSGLCIGCYRTLDEIAGWIDLSEDDRRALIAELPQRRARVAIAGPAPELPHGER
jgi:uncharacterized protein